MQGAIGYCVFCGTLVEGAIGYRVFCGTLVQGAIGYRVFCGLRPLMAQILDFDW